MSNVTPCASSASRALHQSPVSFGRSKIVASLAEAGAGVLSLAGADAVEVDSSPYVRKPAGFRVAPIINIKTTAEESLKSSADKFSDSSAVVLMLIIGATLNPAGLRTYGEESTSTASAPASERTPAPASAS